MEIVKLKRRIYIHIAALIVGVAGILIAVLSGGNGYLNVIPSGTKALVAVDFSKMTWLDLGIGADCGIDFGRKAYLFETSDGSLGLVVAVDSKGDVESWLKSLHKSGKASKITERKGYQFAVINDNFIVGYSSSALLVMGPVIGDEQSQMQRKMVKYLSSDDDNVSGSMLFKHLSEMDSPVAMVAQADALPEKIVTPLVLGAPRGTKADQLLIAATMEMEDECFTVTSRTFSNDKKIDDALKASREKMKPVSDKYLSAVSSDNLLTVACGANGVDFVELLRSNETLRTMLIGINTAIDIDKMLRGVDGDIILSLASLDNNEISLLADARDLSWQKDVDYWKKSCPAGTRIEDDGTNCYRLASQEMNVWFGVKDGKLLYVAPTKEAAGKAGDKAANPISASVADKIKGSRFVAVFNVSAAEKQKPELAVVSSFLPKLKTVVLKVE